MPCLSSHPRRDRAALADAAALLCAHLGPLILAVGILGLLEDSWPNAPWQHGVLHAAFGALLWLYVAARFYERLQRAPAMRPVDLRAFSRQLCRLVYSLLYFLMLVRLIIAVLRGTPDRPIGRAFDDFQGYLACGVIALVAIRGMSALAQRNGRLT